MRKSFVAIALLVGAIASWTTLAVAQDVANYPKFKMATPQAMSQLSRAARLGTSAASDTLYIGHNSASTETYNPYRVGSGFLRPGVSSQNMWDFDTYDGGALDSLQGWVPVVIPINFGNGQVPDYTRPWWSLDFGNRMNAAPVQGRTIGIVGAWHADAGVNAGGASYRPQWTPLAGSASAWCGIRQDADNTYLDDVSRGGTGNAINGSALYGMNGSSTFPTSKNFPGYVNRWDQMLYRDVRVASGASVTVAFKYETNLDRRGVSSAAASQTGWFDKDPLDISPTGGNYISQTLSPGTVGPVDSFMVYVGVPTNPTACRFTDSPTPRAIFDLKRRWFSEVISIDKPYHEILTTMGIHASTNLSVTLDNSVVQPMLAAQGAGDGGGILRVVFRLKTDRSYSDEQGTSAPNTLGGKGGVLVDDVSITGCAVPVSSGFEAASEINNTIEGPNSATPGPSVGQGYALAAWHSTGKPSRIQAHTHPLAGGDIGGGNTYLPLLYEDLCGRWDSPIRRCNIGNVVVSMGDHNDGEVSGGPAGSTYDNTMQAIVGPTINLLTPAVGNNDIGLDRTHAESNADWWFYYDLYGGIFDLANTGCAWINSVMCYPALQANGAQVWSDVCYNGAITYNPDKQCISGLQDYAKDYFITSNPTGIPDSVKLVMAMLNGCALFSVTTLCGQTGGAYFDNISLVIPPPVEGASDKISVWMWDWWTDAFPNNEDDGIPGTARFDTCGANLVTGSNNAQITNDFDTRFNIPGDSIQIATTTTRGDSRLDLVFRIYPGPGNYVVAGNRTSGIRKIPQAAAAAVSGDASFWGQFLANDGEFGDGNAPGNARSGHVGNTWNVNVWNSARCDTLEGNIFPVDGRWNNLSGLTVDEYQSTWHESDPKYATLGILKNKCFVVDTAGTNTSSNNLTCSEIPAWLLVPELAARAGFDGNLQTREFTKIIPDGLLTAGSCVQYFFRLAPISEPASFVMNPDTNFIYPQATQGGYDTDMHRWMYASILPDRWKATEYGGLGSACMLVADYNDRRGDEGPFASVMDSIGGTVAAKYGANTGWHASGLYVASDGSHDFSFENVENNANICVFKNGGQPGTAYDWYNVKGVESINTPTGGLGARLANRPGPSDLTAGKFARTGPTPVMMRTFYKLLLILSGDLNTSFLGRDLDRSSDDITLITNWLEYGASPTSPRGVWGMGDGFAQSMTTPQQLTFLSDKFGATLRDPSYFNLTTFSKRFPDLLPQTVISPTHEIFSVQNSCTFTNDVLLVNGGVTGAVPGAYYEDLNPGNGVGPYISTVYAPYTTSHPFVSLLDGYNITHLFGRYGMNTYGRLAYFVDGLVNVFGSVCSFTPNVTDVPQNTARTVDFLGNIWGNPMVAGGQAIVRFGLAKADRVQVKVYDVTGRLVRTLADRNFDAGEQKLKWDGTNDQGQVVARGVYFTQVKFINSRFEDAKKITVLK